MKQNNQSILDTIKTAVEDLKWSSETKKQKALNLCISIFNLYIYDGGDFNTYKQVASNHINNIIGSKSYVKEIKDNLINNSIIEVNNSYSNKLHTNKGYRFNLRLIYGDFTSSLNSLNNLNQSIKTTILPVSNNLPYHICSLLDNQLVTNDINLCSLSSLIEENIISTLNNITIKPEINDYISKFEIKRIDIKVNNEITEEYVKIVYDNDTYRYKLDTALKQAEENGLDLIQYKDKCYIDNIETFLIRKTNDLKLIYRKSKFDLENKIFRVSRNETNRRLDYNLTNMKSDLLNYLQLDSEDLIELDIANAQFSILSFITKELDEDFISQSQNGSLYGSISKSEWFRVAFDKIKSEQDNIRVIYPKTMKFIDQYKKENGYKSFSNILQNTESLIMIDGLMNILIDKGYEVLPIHDAMRVKKSQVEEVKQIIEEFFLKIDFKCVLRVKNRKDDVRVVEYKYKNFEPVILTITIKDKEDFKKSITRLREGGFEVCLSTLELCGLDKYKMEYLYEIWNKKQTIKIND